ncbi:MAG TPA: LysM peptidoglycan-binding domain-containing protein [Candidatus Sulfotelmatobacter sp.]|nr:LysM peptidoglycan-binding domain-containing protein [Candidatus Sulfotelmatobacter sp.]
MSGPARGPSWAWRCAFCGVLTVSFCAGQARSQDVAEAARQEKARKAAEPQTLRHVYTDDDLKHKVILTPEDQARVEARKKQQGSVPGEQDASAKPQPPDATTAPESLGEIARRYRRENAQREAALAAKKKFTPFPYRVPKDALAEPKTGAAPLTGALPGLLERRTEPPETYSTPKLYPPAVRDHRGRISPFAPRPLIGSAVVAPPAFAVVPAKPVRPIAPSRGPERSAIADPSSGGLKRIRVVQGQSWWKLAETYLGSGARWPELRQLNANAGGPPELLQLGSVVVVPADAAIAKLSSRSITVSKGDTLWSLAEHHLGRGSAWTCLASANPQINDYAHLAIGTILQLPTGPRHSRPRNNVDLIRK